MKHVLIMIILILHVQGSEIEGYATVGIVSHHFTKDAQGNAYNEKHDAYGAELLLDHRYAAAYVHFINSRNNPTDIYALGYRYDVYGSFGIYAAAGYQKGYCFDGLRSVGCTEGRDDSGFAFIPMLYYAHDYFTLDLIPYTDMVALKLNIKLF